MSIHTSVIRTSSTRRLSPMHRDTLYNEQPHLHGPRTPHGTDSDNVKGTAYIPISVLCSVDLNNNSSAFNANSKRILSKDQDRTSLVRGTLTR
jgi:hypothetical protein